MRSRLALCLGLAVGLTAGAAAEEFQTEEMASLAAPAALRPGRIAFSDQAKDIADPVTGLMRFEDWARVRPLQKQMLSLYPEYVEPTIQVTVHGTTKPYLEKLHVYVAEARFLVGRPAASIDLARYASLDFLHRADPSIRHRTIGAGDLMPYKDPESAHNRNPGRRWCEGGGRLVCIESRYQLEGKLPLGIRLANKLEDSGKKIPEVIEFQSELRVLSREDIEQAGLGRLSGIGTPVSGAIEENIFYVNQMMQFGKFLALLQPHPSDPGKTVVSAYVALGIETDVLEKKKEFEAVPVLRNLVPAQVLMGKSSFNTGNSLSAGLPDYARNRIKAIAAILDKE